MSPSPSTYSPGIIGVSAIWGRAGAIPGPPLMVNARARVHSSYWMVNGHQLGSVGEGPLDLDLVEHLGHAVHHIAAREDGGPERHQVGDRTPVADPFQDLGGDQRHRLGIVQLEAAPATAARHLGGDEDEEFVLLARSQMHGMGRRSVIDPLGYSG